MKEKKQSKAVVLKLVSIGKVALLAGLAKVETRVIDTLLGSNKDPDEGSTSLKPAPFNFRVDDKGKVVFIYGSFGQAVNTKGERSEVTMASKQANVKEAQRFLRSIDKVRVATIGSLAQAQARPERVKHAMERWAKTPLLVKGNKKV